jgi:hypothetical protein
MRKLTKAEMKAVSGAGCRTYTDNYGNTQTVCSPSIPIPLGKGRNREVLPCWQFSEGKIHVVLKCSSESTLRRNSERVPNAPEEYRTRARGR